MINSIALEDRSMSAGPDRTTRPSWEERPEKIQAWHLERLAVVYVRQSSMSQVRQNQESTRLQYSLVDVAHRYGWARDRILVVDDDLGLSGASAEGRHGFQRLLSEIALDHVGLVIGVEMSRLARSNKDWHQLLELCARFGALIADLDGLYDPSRYNDRLLLGLKGTMSEAELHILRQRLFEGKLQKARRGELGKPVPAGYLRRPSGEVVLDPDERAREVVAFIFDQFERIGTTNGVLRQLVDQQIQVGIRLRTGPDIGRLVWRRPHRGLLADMLRNPIYAGAYVYGRRRTDPRRKKPGRSATGQVRVSPGQWRVCLRDRLPAYITWEQYERNLARLSANRSRFSERGVVRGGRALLQGILICGRCGRRLSVQYGKSNGHTHARYACNQGRARYGEPTCQGLSADSLDAEVKSLALDALAPAALEISLRVSQDLEKERNRLEDIWTNRLEEARYQAERAARQYHAVEPENRMVARTLERTWEEKLQEDRALKEDYQRFQRQRPRVLNEEEKEQIRALASDLPTLWDASSTSNTDRKAILRLLIDKVVVDVEGETEWVNLVVHWVGGHQTERRVRRPVANLAQLSNAGQLLERIRTLRIEGKTSDQVAETLNDEGWMTPTGRNSFNGRLIRSMMVRYGLTSIPLGKAPPSNNPNEWWLSDLPDELGIPQVTLYGWLRRGWLRARRTERGRRRWIVLLDEAERERLLALRQQHPSPRHRSGQEQA